HVPRGVNVRLRGLLPAVDPDASSLVGLHSCRLEAEARGVGLAPQGVEEMPRVDGAGLAALRELHGDPGLAAGNPPQAGAGEDLHPLVAEGLEDDVAGLGGIVPQEM